MARKKLNRAEKVVWIDKKLHDRVDEIVVECRDIRYPTIKTFINLAIHEKLQREFKEDN